MPCPINQVRFSDVKEELVVPAPTRDKLSPGSVLSGTFLPEPVEVITTMPMGGSVKLVGRASATGPSTSHAPS